MSTGNLPSDHPEGRAPCSCTHFLARREMFVLTMDARKFVAAVTNQRHAISILANGGDEGGVRSRWAELPNRGTIELLRAAICGQMHEEESVNRYRFPGYLAAALLIFLIGVPSGSIFAQQRTQENAASQLPDKAVGSKLAPITMEVYSDFQCPACRDLYRSTLRQVIDTYVAAGKVYLVHRDMPLPIHKFARDAARYANAAGMIGKFERVAEALYAAQDSWSVSGNVEGVVGAVLTPAEMRKVRDLVSGGKVDAAIEKDVALGQRNQVRQTPTVLVTHRGQTTPLPPGGVSYPFLKQYFDYLLRQ